MAEKKKSAPKTKAAPKANGKAGSVEEPAEYQPGPGEQQFIPGTAPKVIQPLIDLAREHEKTKAALKKLKDKKAKEDAEGLILFGKYEQYFTPDPEKPENKVYEALGVKIIIQEKGIQFETRSTPTAASVKADAAAG